MTRAWLVRADEGAGLEKFERDGFVGIRGGRAEPEVVDTDLTDADEESIAGLAADAGLSGNDAAMLRAIAHRMDIGDHVVSPGPHDELGQEVAVGAIASGYRYQPGEPLRHRRDVVWKGRVPGSQVAPRLWAGAATALTEIDPADVPDTS
jgi:predicted Mrr-cat superfamily restriction endonuclease